MMFLFITFIVFVGGGWVIARGLGELFFGNNDEKFIDKSVHYYTTIIKNDNKTIQVIDDKTRKKILELKTTTTKEEKV